MRTKVAEMDTASKERRGRQWVNLLFLEVAGPGALMWGRVRSYCLGVNFIWRMFGLLVGGEGGRVREGGEVRLALSPDTEVQKY